MLSINVATAESYYFVEHNDNCMHITAYFDRSYTLDKLYIPGKIWGTDYSKQITNIKITEGKYKKHNDKNLFYNTALNKVEYDLVNISEDEYLKQFPHHYYHYTNKDRFLLMGMGGFIYPIDIDVVADTTVTIHVNSKLNITGNIRPFSYDDHVIKTNFNELQDIILLGGAKLVNYKEVGVNLLTLNVGNNFYKQVIKIFEQSSRKFEAFWKNYNFSLENKMIMVIAPPESLNKNSYSAYVRRNTMLTFLIPGKNEDIDLSNLFEHELQHFIFGCNAIRGPKWFTEGFSDYYMDKINALAMENIQSFINKYNSKLASYYKSPYSHLTNDEIDNLFFENKEIEKLPYSRGYLIAGQIDTMINLDQIINSMTAKCKAKGTCEFNITTLIENANTLSEYNKIKLRKLIQEFEKLVMDDLIPFKPHFGPVLIR